jgi:predicted nucleic acid-binding protein
MRIVCDADGLIKLHKAGLLALLVHHAEVLIGPEVFREAVTAGMARGYPDAIALAQLLQPHWPQPAPPAHPHAVQVLRGTRLGPGEAEALRLYFHAQGEAILSDDRAFVTLLLTHHIPVLTPATVVVALCEWGLVTVTHATQVLERLRPLIRAEQYHAAQADLAASERKEGP